MARGGPSAMTTGATRTPELLAGTIVRYLVADIVVQENLCCTPAGSVEISAFFVDHS